MKYTIKKEPKNLAVISFEVEIEEQKPFLDDAAERIAEAVKIPGFRPGHAPYVMVEKKVGAMKILEEALEPIVRKFYIETVIKENLETVGQPRIDVQKMAPGNPLLFSTTITLLPTVSKLGNYKGLKVEKKEIIVTDAEVDRVVGDLQKMQTKETRNNRPISGNDKVTLDLTVSKDKVPIEGGSVLGHIVFMNEPYYIPGFTEPLLGMSEDEEKTFTLTFPDSHYQKMLAGKPADFTVKIKEIYERKPPELNDDFAKSLGKTTLAEVKQILKDNITKEKTQKEEDRFEIELLNKIAKDSNFEEIPDLLLNEELERMRLELERGIASQGILWKDYLAQIKKTEPQLKLDFTPQALERIKTALIIKAVADAEKITVSEKEIDEEIERTASFYKDDKETLNQIYSPDYRDRVTVVLKNRKTVARIKELAAK